MELPPSTPAQKGSAGGLAWPLPRPFPPCYSPARLSHMLSSGPPTGGGGPWMIAVTCVQRPAWGLFEADQRAVGAPWGSGPLAGSVPPGGGPEPVFPERSTGRGRDPGPCREASEPPMCGEAQAAGPFLPGSPKSPRTLATPPAASSFRAPFPRVQDGKSLALNTTAFSGCH